MSKAQYEIYLRKVLDLAHTLVIKSSASADSINTSLRERGVSVSDLDPTTWKYYQNLAGIYHSTDSPMTVTSLDTLQTITFSRENLQEHRTTFREYAFGSRFYNELVSRFPTQEILIRGILTPVDIQQAIAAPDGHILHWNSDLVERNETNLIPKLNDWTESFMVRWNVEAFTSTDDLYAASQLAVLYSFLPSVISNLRLANCHTLYAHSYHIREFLASNGRLERYVDHLNKEQMLWLYRNIRYIHRNAGKQETFDLLIENLMTKRGLPLAEWSMRHNLRDQIDEIYPDIEFSRRQLNLGASSAGSDTCTLDELLTKERPAAKDNERIQAEALVSATVAMENSLSNRLTTKVLESSVLDMTDATVFTRSDCLLNHWIYLSSRDQYKAIVVVDNPKTGDVLTLPAKDAFVLFLYSFNRARGFTLQEIPLLEAHNVRRLPVPTKADLRELVDPDLISDAFLTEALDVLTPIKTYISTIGFFEAALDINRVQQHHRLMYVTQHEMHARVHAEMAVRHLYANVPCDFGAGQTYTSWFAARGLNLSNLAELEFDLLANALLMEATGANLITTLSLKDMQGAMLKLMAQLSSYSVQYLQSINSDPITVIEWPAVRVGADKVRGKDIILVDAIDCEVQEIFVKAKVDLLLRLDELAPNTNFRARGFSHDYRDIRLFQRTKGPDTLRIRIDVPPIRVLGDLEYIDKIATDVVNLDTEHYVPVDRLLLDQAFIALLTDQYVLTLSNRQTLRNRWQAWREQNENTLVTELPGLVYPEAVLVTELPGLEYPSMLTPFITELNGLTYPQGGEDLEDEVIVEGLFYTAQI